METATDYYAVHRHHCTIRRIVSRIANEIAYPVPHGEPPPITLEALEPAIRDAVDGCVAGETGGRQAPSTIRDARSGAVLR